jgi:hypothetical protein
MSYDNNALAALYKQYKLRRYSITKELAKRFGGKWVYNRHTGWWNSENGWYVACVHWCEHDDICHCPRRYCLYKPTGSEWIDWL